MSETKALSVSEGIGGTFFYHLSRDGGIHSICGVPTMPTRVPVSAWGVRTHLNERYCTKCEIVELGE